MAGTVQTLTNLLNPVTGTVHLRSLNSKSNKHSFNVINNSLIHTKARSITPTLIIRNHTNSDQIHGNGGADLPARKSGILRFSVVVEPLFSFASNNFLPLALVGGVALGLANPVPGCIAHRYQLSKVSAFGIFIISGLTLRSEDISAAAETWPVGLFGLVSILLLTPNLSRIILQLHLQPQEFVTGLALFSCMPTTLSSGVALTRLAGGNAALALAMTVTSSLLAIIILPFSISNLIACGLGATVPTGKLFRRLIFTLLIPLILGKVIIPFVASLRDRIKYHKFLIMQWKYHAFFLFKKVIFDLADFADNNRKLLSVLSVLLLSLVPWIQVSRSRPLLLMVKPAAFLVVVIMGILLHVILLGFNAISIRCLCALSGGSKSIFAKKENSTALLLVASQKALPVLVAVVDQLGCTFGESGLLIIPCIAAHLNQIIMGSILVSYWNKNEHSLDNTKAT
ncbi:putative sodium bile acid cotransporter, sodium/solute symporter superfamily [Helianthus annuus]|nr:putative sodium bile acid cotransporter, sodium/solute symporter superfamily [Helianthus annuus]